MIFDDVVLEYREKFRAGFIEIVRQYNISISRKLTYTDAQRIGHLCSTLMIKVYKNADIGIDAYICFVEWARKKKLRCDEVVAMERHGGKVKNSKIHQPFPSVGKRVFDNLTFDRYFIIADEVLSKKRFPLLVRTPVTHLEVK